MNTKKNSSIEIDVLSLFISLWSKKFRIIFISLIFAIAAFFGSVFLINPKYTATTRVYVVNQNNQNNQSNITAQDLQAGTYLVSDYKEIITSHEVITDVIVKNNLNMSINDLTKSLSVSIPSDTRVISISVTDTEPKKATKLANSIRKVAAEKIKEVTKVQDVTTLEKAEVPESPSSPNIKRNTLIGFVLGGFVAVISILLVELLDDRVKSSDDVEDVLGMTLLGVVPDVDKL